MPNSGLCYEIPSYLIAGDEINLLDLNIIRQQTDGMEWFSKNFEFSRQLRLSWILLNFYLPFDGKSLPVFKDISNR